MIRKIAISAVPLLSVAFLALSTLTVQEAKAQ